jgi:hypothetical protein
VLVALLRIHGNDRAVDTLEQVQLGDDAELLAGQLHRSGRGYFARAGQGRRATVGVHSPVATLAAHRKCEPGDSRVVAGREVL